MGLGAFCHGGVWCMTIKLILQSKWVVIAVESCIRDLVSETVNWALCRLYYLWPSKAATSNGVMPSLSSWSTSAPRSSKMFTTCSNQSMSSWVNSCELVNHLVPYTALSQNNYHSSESWRIRAFIGSPPRWYGSFLVVS